MSLFTERTLTGMILDKAETMGDKVVLRIVGEDLDYVALVERSNAMAHGLRDLSIGPGDVVAIMTENCADQVIAEFATARLRAIEVMLNTAYRGDFLAHQLRVSQAKVIIIDVEHLGTLIEVLEGLPDLRHVVVRNGSAPDGLFGRDGHEVASLYAHASTASELEDPQWTDSCTVAFTSGTTGPSKGATMTQNYMVNFARICASIWNRTPDDAIYSCGPVFHLGAKGIAVLAAIQSGRLCVQDARFSPSTFWQRIRDEECNVSLTLGSMAMLLWTQEPRDGDGVDVLIGVPAPPKDMQAASEERWGCKWESVYGMSEATPMSVTGPDVPLRPGSAGKVVREYLDVRIVDDNDFALPPGEVGEVVVRPVQPHSMFEGYYRNPEATLSKYRNLWFHTGDLGRLDEDDYFYFEDRKDDYLRKGGENISSYEAESAIVKHPAVLNVGVVGVSSDLGEQEVLASVVLRPGAELTHEELIEHCIEAMPYFAVPRYVEFVDELPTTPTGKLQKEKIRRHDLANCWDREAAGIFITRTGRRGERTSQSAAIG